MSRYLIIAPLSLLVVMVLYLVMHSLLHQPHTIEFKENDSEFVFEDFKPLPRTIICSIPFQQKQALTKAELWQKTNAIISQYNPPICYGYDLFPVNSFELIQKTSQSILNELIPKDPFTAFEQNKPKPPYN